MKFTYKTPDGRYFQESYVDDKLVWKYTDDLSKAYKETMHTPQYERYVENKFNGMEYERVELL